MRKRAVKDMDMADSSTLNRISPAINISFNVLFILFALICIIPVVFVFIISISSEQSIKLNGYRFWPQEFSLESYLFLWKEGKMIIRALGISAAVTVAGTAFGVILTTLMGYVLSIRKF